MASTGFISRPQTRSRPARRFQPEKFQARPVALDTYRGLGGVARDGGKAFLGISGGRFRRRRYVSLFLAAAANILTTPLYRTRSEIIDAAFSEDGGLAVCRLSDTAFELIDLAGGTACGVQIVGYARRFNVEKLFGIGRDRIEEARIGMIKLAPGRVTLYFDQDVSTLVVNRRDYVVHPPNDVVRLALTDRLDVKSVN